MSLDDSYDYPLHEEDDGPETAWHKVQSTDVFDILRVRFPERFVMGNICLYWEPGNTRRYAAPDVFVAAGFPADREPRVYLLWEDPPVLFAVEIGCRSILPADTGPRPWTYERHVKAREYLYYTPMLRELRFWRMGPDGYQRIAPEPNGRWRSLELDLEFAVDGDGYLRIYTLEGERLLNHPEEAQRRREAEMRAAEAEARATVEVARRRELERQLAVLQAQLQAREDRET
jgi:hypothetical protein